MHALGAVEDWGERLRGDREESLCRPSDRCMYAVRTVRNTDREELAADAVPTVSPFRRIHVVVFVGEGGGALSHIDLEGDLEGCECMCSDGATSVAAPPCTS